MKYEQDARRRQSEGKLLPGEILEEVVVVNWRFVASSA